ncbi:Signal transduction histidine kinase [Krasilnikoviella flava]|uniref:histidine kinase n=2 Tax=Krasilnikoviella flava TaxID=526729 RepID=A0A1T5KWA9_9MICO|nr:Signal transduction histidine kinase [Krasilnikoviella flava]
MSGLTILVVCLAVVVPVPFVAEPDRMLVPLAVWLLLAVAWFAATAVAVLQPPRTRAAYVALAAQTLLTAALVVTVPGIGWLPILLVFGAALSTYVGPTRVVVAVVVINTAALLVAFLLAPGQARAFEIVLSLGLYLLLQVASAAVSIALQREQRMRTELTVAHAELAAAAVRDQEATRASERLRISRELHDLIGHQLTVLTLELESAAHLPGERGAAHVERARAVARALLGDVRATVGELRRRAPDLRAALDTVAAAVPSPRVEVSVADDVVADEEQTAALVRVTQEVVTNAVRHAEMATVLRIEVGTGEDGVLTFLARDDGLTSGPVRLGHGLAGIVERAEALGGGATFDASAGFTVEARLAGRVAS